MISARLRSRLIPAPCIHLPRNVDVLYAYFIREQCSHPGVDWNQSVIRDASKQWLTSIGTASSREFAPRNFYGVSSSRVSAESVDARSRKVTIAQRRDVTQYRGSNGKQICIRATQAIRRLMILLSRKEHNRRPLDLYTACAALLQTTECRRNFASRPHVAETNSKVIDVARRVARQYRLEFN